MATRYFVDRNDGSHTWRTDYFVSAYLGTRGYELNDLSAPHLKHMDIGLKPVPPVLAERVMRVLPTIFAHYDHHDPFRHTTACDVAYAYGEAALAFLDWLIPQIKPGPFLRNVADLPGAEEMIYKVTAPFNTETMKLRQFGLYPHFLENVTRETAKLGKSGSLIFPQHNPNKEKIVDRYLAGTPLWALFDLRIHFQPFSEINRCAHHWCLGKTRRGKTTFLRYLIRFDLKAAEERQCSLVVIDSKTLIHEMRTLKQFAPGGKLDGQVMLIDSDGPMPLNPFRIKDKALARSVLIYMLGGMQNASDLQSGALGFYVDAALQSRDKSLGTLLAYMRLPRDGVPKEIGSFDEELQGWFRETRKKLQIATTGGIEQRLANFMREHRHTPIFKMLTADDWSLDLGDFEQGGKVLLVDTDWERNTEDGTHLMGRLFIALLEHTATKRMKKPGKPIWAYIDEASDYLEGDKNFVQILIKAAAAKVGMTVAYQYKGMPGVGPDIEKALDNAEIHSHIPQRGTVNMTVEERPLTLQIDKLEFKDEPQMSPEEYRGLRESLQAKFPVRASKKPPPPAKPPLTQKF
jgi:hypothetical protein